MVSFIVFLFGLVVGSFLHSVIYRLGKGESALKGRSYCPQCKHPLSWQDLIPLLSFALLQGKCRYCRAKISWQYPLVELGTATLFVVIFNFQFSIFNEFSVFQFSTLFYLWVIASLLVVIFVYDLKHYIIPDKVLYPAIALAFFWRLLESIVNVIPNLIGDPALWIPAFAGMTGMVLAGLGAGAFFFAIYALSKGRAMGFGDVKLAFFLGLFLGWPNILVALFSAFTMGALVGIALIAAKKKQLRSQVPFGPFLIGGTFFALLFGEAITHWYLGLLMV